jgi:DMSO/TMAO reductase YedYZ heme-binding membrane subunit
MRSLAAFPRFVLHDLRLSARSLASMFGLLSLRRLAALIALVFVALHVAAYPVAAGSSTSKTVPMALRG